MKKIQRLFIANRGEIAQRIIDTARKMQIETVVPVSDVDQNLDYVGLASETVTINTNLSESFLNPERMIELAQKSQSDAIHPGYGFLSESEEFAQSCLDAGLIWIGPSPGLIHQMGNKQQAIEIARMLGIPTLDGRFGNAKKMINGIKADDFPLVVKANNGGGGKGIHIVHDLDNLRKAIEQASREAQNFFRSPDIFIEKYLPNARHIEVQVMCDHHGNAVHFFTRECSVQRRFQKLVEEAPATGLSRGLLDQLIKSALKICHFIHYKNAGTVEFLVDGEDFYFLEMNTRIQVEHSVTEAITGADLIGMQIRIASGERLKLKQSEIKACGHAIESRIYAEDPQNGFAPDPGGIRRINYPESKDLRIETALRKPQTLPVYYDPLVAKFITKETNRTEAIRSHQRALQNTLIEGISTTSDFLNVVVDDDRFKKNTFYTKLLDNEMSSFLERIEATNVQREKVFIGIFQFLLHKTPCDACGNDAWDSIGRWRSVSGGTVYVNNEQFTVENLNIEGSSVSYDLNDQNLVLEKISKVKRKISCRFEEQEFVFFLNNEVSRNGLEATSGNLSLDAKMYNEKKTDLALKDISHENQCIEVKASLPGKVVKLNVKEGDKVSFGEQLFVFESMKIENSIQASGDGTISRLNIREGQHLSQNEIVLTIKDY